MALDTANKQAACMNLAFTGTFLPFTSTTLDQGDQEHLLGLARNFEETLPPGGGGTGLILRQQLGNAHMAVT